MKTFNMYVKTVIHNEQDKVLLLKQKRKDKKQRWDLPGSTFTEEQSFDETVITNVQKEIGLYVYPGKIIGIGDYSNNKEKEVHVIMEGTILNGELLLSKDYETFTWVKLSRIADYPLVPWLHNYIHNVKNPFTDVETEIEELNNNQQRRREFFNESIRNPLSSKNKSKKSEKKRKSSFSILKETIHKTFHPRGARTTQTTPKPNNLYQPEEVEVEENEMENKLNFRRKKEEPISEYVEESIHKNNEDDIIIEHTTPDNTNDDIIISHDNIVKEDSENIIIEHENKDSEEIIPDKDKILEPIDKDKKIFDMNVNKEVNTKRDDKNQHNIKVIHKDEKTPLIRTEKEDKERISFNSENIRDNWKERLNRINRTEANKTKKEAPRPRGHRK